MNVWKQVLVRIAQKELKTWDMYCEKNHLKRVELIRNSVRATIANPNLAKNTVVTTDYSVETRPLMDAIRKLSQKLENIERSLNSKSFETNHTDDNVVKNKIKECVKNIMSNTKTASTTTMDRLREQIKDQDPLLTPYLVSSSNRAFSLLDEVLLDLQAKGEIKQKHGGIVKFERR